MNETTVSALPSRKETWLHSNTLRNCTHHFMNRVKGWRLWIYRLLVKLPCPKAENTGVKWSVCTKFIPLKTHLINKLSSWNWSYFGLSKNVKWLFFREINGNYTTTFVFYWLCNWINNFSLRFISRAHLEDVHKLGKYKRDDNRLKVVKIMSSYQDSLNLRNHYYTCTITILPIITALYSSSFENDKPRRMKYAR